MSNLENVTVGTVLYLYEKVYIVLYILDANIHGTKYYILYNITSINELHSNDTEIKGIVFNYVSNLFGYYKDKELNLEKIIQKPNLFCIKKLGNLDEKEVTDWIIKSRFSNPFINKYFSSL